MNDNTGSLGPLRQRAEVRGLSACNRAAKIHSRIVSLLVDFAAFFGPFCFALSRMDIVPVPSAAIVASMLTSFFALLFVQRKIFKASLGQWIWKLRITSKGVLQLEHYHLANISSAISLTLLILGFAFWAGRVSIFSSPVWKQEGRVALLPFAPEADKKDEWLVAPFFYALGAWPLVFEKQPVLHTLPYRKGPPNRFVAQVTARWQMPDITLTLEGPRTPIPADESRRLKTCFHSASPITAIACASLKERALGRHLREMSGLRPTEWTIRWVSVQNPSLKEEEHAEGVYLSASSPLRAQDRFVLITSSGTHQSFILNRPVSSKGLLARRTFEQVLGTLRVPAKLSIGRQWVNRSLASTQLGQIRPESASAEILPRLARIQALLISKISVDPRTYDSYFHLGGTAMMLARFASKEKNFDLSAVAKPLLQASVNYAEDINPDDPRTSQLQDLWIDAKKL